MSEEDCSLVFTGRIVEGMSLETVQENLAALFKTDIEKIKQKFSDQRTLIKRHLDEPTCRRMQKRLLEAGAVCEIESNAAKAALQQTAAGDEAPSGPRPTEPSANPYAAPRAELKQGAAAGAKDFIDPQKRKAGRGAAWFFQAIGLFLKSPFVWILTIICFFLIGLIQMIPIIGPIAMSLLGPVFLAGLILGAKELDENDMLRVGALFQGFQQGLGQLVLLGLLFLVAAVVGVVLAMAVSFATMGMSLLNMEGQAAQTGASAMAVLLMVLLMLGVFVPIMMGYWFAPALIAINEKPVFEAIALSFKGCLRNIFPFLVYSLVALGVGVVAGLLVAVLFGLFVFGAGGGGVLSAILSFVIILPLMFALMPIYVSSIYTSYKDVFYLN